MHKGKIITKNLASERLTPNDLSILLRKQGIHKISELDSAVLESDGSLSVSRLVENHKD